MKKILLIDCNWLFNTFYFVCKRELDGLQGLNWDAEKVTLVSNKVMTNILSIVASGEYDEFYTFFDLGGENFRNELFPPYKQHRSKEPKFAFKEEIQHLMIALETVGILPIGKIGWEADDLIGSWANWKINNENCECHILTKDKDLFQLINEQTSILFKTKESNGSNTLKKIDLTNFKEYFDVETPKQIIDFKAIGGDSSDGYHGPRGLGEVATSNLLAYFKNLENLLDYVNQNEFDYEVLKQNGITNQIWQKVVNNIDIIERNKILATIKTDFFDNLNQAKINEINTSTKPNDFFKELAAAINLEHQPFYQSNFFFSKMEENLKAMNHNNTTKKMKRGL